MTIVTMNRGIVAVDSRRRVVKDDSVHDDSQKLVIVDHLKLKWEDEKLLVIARCGSTMVTNAIVRMIKDGASADMVMRALNRRVFLRKMGNRSGCVLVRSTDSAWLIRYRNGMTQRRTLSVGEPFAIGAGSQIAEFLMESLDYSATLAAAAIATAHPNCGGVINQYIVKQKRMGRPLATDTKPDHYLAKGVEYAYRRMERKKSPTSSS